jgi:hypothetical protein
VLVAEAQRLGELLGRIPEERLSPLLNLGSSTLQFRTLGQPHIDRYVFAPLRARGCEIIHTDIKCEPGVDLVGDLTDAGFLDRLRALHVRSVLVSNLLEHVTDRRLIIGPGCGPRRRHDRGHRTPGVSLPWRPYRHHVSRRAGRSRPGLASHAGARRGDDHHRDLARLGARQFLGPIAWQATPQDGDSVLAPKVVAQSDPLHTAHLSPGENLRPGPRAIVDATLRPGHTITSLLPC